MTTHSRNIDLFQVETIGDAYMVAAGVPEVSDKHAQKSAEMALDMQMASRKVLSPVNSQPIQVSLDTLTVGIVVHLTHLLPEPWEI